MSTAGTPVFRRQADPTGPIQFRPDCPASWGRLRWLPSPLPEGGTPKTGIPRVDASSSSMSVRLARLPMTPLTRHAVNGLKTMRQRSPPARPSYPRSPRTWRRPLSLAPREHVCTTDATLHRQLASCRTAQLSAVAEWARHLPWPVPGIDPDGQSALWRLLDAPCSTWPSQTSNGRQPPPSYHRFPATACFFFFF